MREQITREGGGAALASGVGDDLDEIELAVRRARLGELSQELAFEAIGRVVRRNSPPGVVYQKPWG